MLYAKLRQQIFKAASISDMTLINKWSVYIAHKVYRWQLGNIECFMSVWVPIPQWAIENLVITLVVAVKYVLKIWY